jgi:transcriptional regulator with XRE-family HTH domain
MADEIDVKIYYDKLLAERDAEIERLRATLKAARTWAREQKQTTTREFAAVCGVTPTQLSQWTCDTSTLGEPDFKD